MKTRIISYTLALAVLLSSFGAGAAFAGSKGRKNTTLLLGAATIHQALKGKTTNAVVLGAGTAYSYKRYRDARKAEKRRQRATRYYQRRTVRSYR
ncbi:MAG: hypothetical protein KY468_19585 [Armatimonadetes bacterium]|nr:hypothetical protein [Armatimonadota bacterium]